MSGMEFCDCDKVLCICSLIVFKLFILDYILYLGVSEDLYIFVRKFLFIYFFKNIILK